MAVMRSNGKDPRLINTMSSAANALIYVTPNIV
jgi:hypothetical protein